MAKEKELENEDDFDQVESKKTTTKKKTVRKKVVRKKKIAKKKVANLCEDEVDEVKNDSVNAEEVVEPKAKPEPGPPPPEEIDLSEFQNRSMVELYELGSSLGLRVGGMRSKHDIVFEILCHWGKRGTKIRAQGFLETAKDGYGFLRVPTFSFAKHADDVYIGSNFIKEYDLRVGNFVTVIARAPKDRERFLSTNEVLEVEGIPAEDWEAPALFENLTAISPRERIILEPSDGQSVSPRVVDLIAPLGKGQRGVIVAPPRGGKTILLKEIAKSIVENHKEVELLILLLDERPEEVTDFEESVPDAQVYSSTFDETPDRHVSVAELVAERAKRVTELGKDAVILMDSLTRLARGYNGLISTGGRGRGRRGKGRGKGRTGSEDLIQGHSLRPEKYSVLPEMQRRVVVSQCLQRHWWIPGAGQMR